MSLPHLISSRAAETRLAHVGVARRQARRVLAAGFAGAPIVTPSARLYSAERVDELAGWPVVPETVVDEVCPSGIFVARRDLDLWAPRSDQLDCVRDGWDLSPFTSVWMRVVCERDGFLPLVVTVGGFVALGADIAAVWRVGVRLCRLDLRPPGAWYATFDGARFNSGPGRDWVLRGSPWKRVG